MPRSTCSARIESRKFSADKDNQYGAVACCNAAPMKGIGEAVSRGGPYFRRNVGDRLGGERGSTHETYLRFGLCAYAADFGSSTVAATISRYPSGAPYRAGADGAFTGFCTAPSGNSATRRTAGIVAS